MYPNSVEYMADGTVLVKSDYSPLRREGVKWQKLLLLVADHRLGLTRFPGNLFPRPLRPHPSFWKLSSPCTFSEFLRLAFHQSKNFVDVFPTLHPPRPLIRDVVDTCDIRNQ